MSFWKHCYHIVWATKGREPLILPEIEPRLYTYIAHKAGELGVFLHAIGGIEDHMHIVPAIPPKHSVAWVVKMLKGASAHFVNTELRPPGMYFAWQRGYGSLTVGEKQRAAAVDYVLRQKEHHQHHTTNIWLERYGDEDDQNDSDDAAEDTRPERLVREVERIRSGTLHDVTCSRCGAASVGSKAYIEAAYPRTKNDLYAAFVEGGLELLRPGGYLGAITSRTGFFLTSFQKWREEILLKEARLIAVADLGYGVLDTAMVETAAYVLQRRCQI